jgi:anti-sigma factor RsiW
MIESMMRALDDELSNAETQALEAHLQTCAVCNAEWTALRAAHVTLTHTAFAAPSDSFAERVMARVAIAETQRTLRHNIFGWLTFTLGAFAVTTLTIASLPLGELARPISIASIIDTLISLGNVLSVLLAWGTTVLRVVAQVMGGNLVMLLALTMLAMTMGWARLVTGQALFRYTT